MPLKLRRAYHPSYTRRSLVKITTDNTANNGTGVCSPVQYSLLKFRAHTGSGNANGRAPLAVHTFGTTHREVCIFQP